MTADKTILINGVCEIGAEAGLPVIDPTTSRVSLEPGGSAPAIIWKDANLDLAVDAIAFATFENTGQVCTSSDRIVVHTDFHDEFVDRLVERANRLKLGAPHDDVDLDHWSNGRNIGRSSRPSTSSRRKAASSAVAAMASLPYRASILSAADCDYRSDVANVDI